MKQIELELNGLNCAGCAGKIEKLSNELDGVETANLDFVSKKLKVNVREDEKAAIITEEIKRIVNKLEPHVKVIDKAESHDHNHEHSDGCCGHDHGGETSKKEIIKLAIGGLLFILPYLLKLEGTPRLMVYVLSYIIVGHEVILIAVKNILAGIPFDENFLTTIATIGAFVIGEYPEGVAVMLFYQVGEMFQGMAVNHSRKSISSLLDIRPDSANLERNGKIIVVDPNEVNIGDIVIVRPGEKVPLDGIVVEGESSLDTSNITGESVPRNVGINDNVLSGTVNNHGLLKIKVTKKFGESTVSKILDLVENASSKKAPTEKFITKFARYYTPIVVFAALAIAIIPTVFMGGDLREWAYSACVFLVISCPCALVISIPLGFFGGIGGSSKAGILVKGGNYLEALTGVDTIVFDKTGTITKGTFKVTEIISYGEYSKEEILELAAYGESHSNHPIGKSILEAYNKEINKEYIKSYKEIAGKGIEVSIDGKEIILGNKKIFDEKGIKVKESDSIGTVVYIGKSNKHIGTIIVSDELKDNVVEDIKKLKSLGIKRTIMLSGDNESTAEKVGELVGLNKVYGNLLPQDKVNKFEDIVRDSKGKVVFVGDGVNDAPVLARADVGIAMGGLGSDAAIEASDIVIMTDEVGKIATGIKIARNTKKIVTQNIVLALGLKIVVLVLGAMGMATMWEAVFADVGVSIIAILNSIRALKIEE
ncbi:cadmium-translocating P-type ATPase [Tissierella pigra]|uniref:Cd(2+)-exporting ATPase n=1 Tax=Tissierella pigra TaxID=2607614 RepID=A0A6N7XLE7_9FIRM|nr:heavy metal translocating P-type ATPase [Tissierella pigra]MBU5425820.1 cadmium-translocating P-type ATPase [Tissierella pigra]MSU01602.1 cadmium-translocating P-type ATPase [Tissierella pigra]